MKQEMNDEELDRRAAIIIDKFAGIHPPFEAFYIHSILYSAGRSSAAFQRFDVARYRDSFGRRYIGRNRRRGGDMVR